MRKNLTRAIKRRNKFRFLVECSFAKNLQAFREEQGLTREEIAEGLSRITGKPVQKAVIYQMETVRVRPSIGRISDLCIVLNCEPADLLEITVQDGDEFMEEIREITGK